MISSTADLKTEIFALEAKRLAQEEELKIQFHRTRESLTPVNLIKKAIHGITGDSAVKNNLLNATVGIGAVLATRKLLFNKLSGSIFKRVLGGLIEFGVGKAASSGTGLLKYKGLQILSSLLKKKKRPVTHMNGADKYQ